MIFMLDYTFCLLYLFTLLSYLQEKRNPGVFMWGRAVWNFINLFSIKVADKPNKLCLASRSLTQWIIYWLYCAILSHCQNFDAIIMLLCHLAIPGSGMISTKFKYIEQGWKTTSLISNFQKRGHKRFYNFPWYVIASDNT